MNMSPEAEEARRKMIQEYCDLQEEIETGATGLEPATFGFGDRRNARQANGLTPPWGRHGDGSGQRDERTP